MAEEFTTIRIGKKDRDKLEQLRQKESYSDVVSRLLDDGSKGVATPEVIHKPKRKVIRVIQKERE